METLREEVLSSQSVRSDLLKYKVLVVGAIGAAGLGLAGSKVKGHLDLVLAAVPLVCLYIDLLCRHLSLRILVIGSFIRERGAEPLAAYEEHAEAARNLAAGWFGKRSAFALEDWAVSGSTLALSVAVLVYGIFAIGDNPWWFYWTLMVSGGAGIVVTAAEFVVYRKRSRLLTSLHTGTATSPPARLASAVMLIAVAAAILKGGRPAAE